MVTRLIRLIFNHRSHQRIQSEELTLKQSLLGCYQSIWKKKWNNLLYNGVSSTLLCNLYMENLITVNKEIKSIGF